MTAACPSCLQPGSPAVETAGGARYHPADTDIEVRDTWATPQSRPTGTRPACRRARGWIPGRRSQFIFDGQSVHGAPLGENGSVARLPAHAHQARLRLRLQDGPGRLVAQPTNGAGRAGGFTRGWGNAGPAGATCLARRVRRCVAIAAAAFWQHASTETPLAEPFKITPLTSHTGFERYSSFSPDGRHVAFSWRNDSGGPFHIHTKAIESGSTVQRTSHHVDDLSPAWSPDGHFIAFLRSLSGDTGPTRAHFGFGRSRARADGDISPAESAPSSVILFGHDLAWSPDSRFLVVPSGDPPKEPFGLLLVSIESGATRRLLAAPPGTGPYLAPAVSPDGRHLAFVRRTDFAVSEIWMNTLSGDFTPQGEPIRMTYGNRLTTSPVWAGPRELLFLSGEVGAEAGLYRMSIGQPGTPRPMPSLGEGAALLSVLPGSGSLSWPRLRLGFTRVVKDHNIYRTESNGPRYAVQRVPSLQLLYSNRFQSAVFAGRQENHIRIDPLRQHGGLGCQRGRLEPEATHRFRRAADRSRTLVARWSTNRLQLTFWRTG